VIRANGLANRWLSRALSDSSRIIGSSLGFVWTFVNVHLLNLIKRVNSLDFDRLSSVPLLW